MADSESDTRPRTPESGSYQADEPSGGGGGNHMNEQDQLLLSQSIEHEIIDDSLDLSRELVSENLSMLSRTTDGLSFAYVKCEVQNKKLKNLDGLARGTGFPHLRVVDFSHNKIVDATGLNSLGSLLSLNLEHNQLTQIFANIASTNIQQININQNSITEVEPISFPLLTNLMMEANFIKTVRNKFVKCPALQHLSLSSNNISDFDGKSLPALKFLDLSRNQITSMLSLENLTTVETLNLRGNTISSLDYKAGTFSNSLKKLNVRQNNISTMRGVLPLQTISSLAHLVLRENQGVDGEQDRLVVLSLLPSLTHLDKAAVTREERDAANATAEENKRAIELSGIDLNAGGHGDKTGASTPNPDSQSEYGDGGDDA